LCENYIMGKITVKHYLNTRLRPIEINKELTFPVYIRVSFGRRNARISSRWIPHSQSERAMESDKTIIDLMNYESGAIEKGLELLGYNEKIQVHSLLRIMLHDLLEYCIDGHFEKDRVVEQFVMFIQEKTKLSKSILSRFFKFKEWHFEEIYELTNNEIFDYSLNIRMIYYGMLLEFESIYYHEDTQLGFKVGCLLTFYDWIYRNGKDDFIKFAKNKQLIPISDILSLTDELTEKMIGSIKFWSFMN